MPKIEIEFDLTADDPKFIITSDVTNAAYVNKAFANAVYHYLADQFVPHVLIPASRAVRHLDQMVTLLQGDNSHAKH